jgi:DNA-binding response OmpR family regulator
MEKKYKIILVEDDNALGYLLKEYLGMKGLEMSWAKNGKEALRLMEENAFDLAILDIMMPDMDGFELASKLQKSKSDLPFLFLSARSMKIDVLKGFSLGAVDYLKKPIDEEELVVRINALLSRLAQPGRNKETAKTYSIGKYKLDSTLQQLDCQGHSVQLTARENDLLVYLAQRRNQLCSHKDILINIWGKNDYFNRKSLNVFISHLRKHLEKDESVKIENIHGRGFILRID